MPLECTFWLESTPKVIKTSNFVSFLPFLSIFFIKSTSKVPLNLWGARKLKGARKFIFKGCAKIKGAKIKSARKLKVINKVDTFQYFPKWTVLLDWVEPSYNEILQLFLQLSSVWLDSSAPVSPRSDAVKDIDSFLWTRSLKIRRNFIWWLH